MSGDRSATGAGEEEDLPTPPTATTFNIQLGRCPHTQPPGRGPRTATPAPTPDPHCPMPLHVPVPQGALTQSWVQPLGDWLGVIPMPHVVARAPCPWDCHEYKHNSTGTGLCLVAGVLAEPYNPQMPQNPPPPPGGPTPTHPRGAKHVSVCQAHVGAQTRALVQVPNHRPWAGTTHRPVPRNVFTPWLKTMDLIKAETVADQ